MPHREFRPQRIAAGESRQQRGWRQTVVTMMVTALLGGLVLVFAGEEENRGAEQLAPPRPESLFQACKAAKKSGKCPLAEGLDEDSLPDQAPAPKATGTPFALSAP